MQLIRAYHVHFTAKTGLIAKIPQVMRKGRYLSRKVSCVVIGTDARRQLAGQH